MKYLIVKIARIALKIWKPDFRKTTGWLFITTGLLTLAPPFIHEIILSLWGMIDIEMIKTIEKSDTIGALLVFMGIIFHLFYLSDKPRLRNVETFLGVLLIISAILLVVLTL